MSPAAVYIIYGIIPVLVTLMLTPVIDLVHEVMTKRGGLKACTWFIVLVVMWTILLCFIIK